MEQLNARNDTAKNMCLSLGIGINTVHKLLGSDATSLSLVKFCAIADYLGVSTDYLLGRTDEP